MSSPLDDLQAQTVAGQTSDWGLLHTNSTPRAATAALALSGFETGANFLKCEGSIEFSYAIREHTREDAAAVQPQLILFNCKSPRYASIRLTHANPR
jgi:hypothetical protein